jgi:hypothetical protein
MGKVNSISRALMKISAGEANRRPDGLAVYVLLVRRFVRAVALAPWENLFNPGLTPDVHPGYRKM